MSHNRRTKRTKYQLRPDWLIIVVGFALAIFAAILIDMIGSSHAPLP